MQSMPRPVLVVVAALLGATALFGLASGVTTSLGRSVAPQTDQAPGAPAAGEVVEAQPIDELAPPPPPVPPEKTDEEKAEEAKKAEEDKKKKEEAAKARAAEAALPDEPEPYAPIAGPAAPPAEPPVITPSPPAQNGGPALY